jgi:hypothetical protein
MHPALRSILVPLLLLVPTAALDVGCSAGADMEDTGPTVTATAPDESTDPSSGAASEQAGPPSDEPTSTPSELSDAVAAVCTPYAEMVTAVQHAATESTDPDAVAAKIGPVMKKFAAQVPDLQRPPGMPASTWRGVQALAARILKLPARPTNAEIEAVESQLSAEERDAVEAAATWFRTSCGL